jgi:hypothetical protein
MNQERDRDDRRRPFEQRTGAPPGRDAGLTAADRRAIEAIRRELDRDFGPIDPDERPAQASVAAERAPRSRTAGDGSSRRSGSSYARLNAALTIGALMIVAAAGGGIAGSALTLRSVAQRGAGADTGPGAHAGDARPDPSAARQGVKRALDAWLEATTLRDIPGQMAFYPPVVPVFHAWRNTPREAVREEKERAFGAARGVAIQTDAPEIEVSRDGTTAVTRFRKKYVIEGPRAIRRGEVLQELRWIRTADGWKIIGERDLAVLSQS